MIRNGPEVQIRADAGYEAVVDKKLFEDVQELNEARGKSQRGTTRARDPYRYPLSGRIYCASPGCGWPMYGFPRGSRQAHVCGRYHVSSGDACEHNAVDADAALAQVLRSVRMNVLRHDLRAQVRQELLKIAQAGESRSANSDRAGQLRAELTALEDGLKTGRRNMLMAKTDEIRAAMEQEFESMTAEAKSKKAELEQIQQKVPAQASPEAEVEKAMALLDDLDRLAKVARGPELQQLLNLLNVNVWLRFQKVQKGKRLLNKVRDGIITTGNAPHPIQKYDGPRNGSAASNHMAGMKNTESEGPGGPPDSLQKMNRGDRI